MFDCLLILEQKDGQITRPSLHLCARLQGFPGWSGVSVTAMIFGACPAESLKKLGDLGIQSLYQVEGKEPADTETRLQMILNIVREHNFLLVILPGTWRGRELAPGLAAKLDAGVVADCEWINYSDRLELVVQAYNRQYQHIIELTGQHKVVLMTDVDPGAMEPIVPVECILNTVSAPIIDGSVRQILGTYYVPAAQLDIGEADIIIGIGRGVEDKDDLNLVQELASALGATLAGSRPAVDAGLIPFNRQIGQTGRIVAPQLYIALGISGATQHISGVTEAKIIAVNNDPQAPILRLADLAVIGDLRKVVPLLTKLLRQNKEGRR